MNRRVLMVIAVFIGALLQQLVPPAAFFAGMKPPLLGALALYCSLRRGGREMWTVILAAALLQDGLEYGKFGPALMTFPLFGVLGDRIRSEIFADGLVTQLTFGAAMGLFTTFAALMIYGITGQRPMHFGFNLMRLIGSALMGMVALPVISLIMNRLEAALPKRRGYGWQ